jgi:hypothetical protein
LPVVRIPCTTFATTAWVYIWHKANSGGWNSDWGIAVMGGCLGNWRAVHTRRNGWDPYGDGARPFQSKLVGQCIPGVAVAGSTPPELSAFCVAFARAFECFALVLLGLSCRHFTPHKVQV